MNRSRTKDLGAKASSADAAMDSLVRLLGTRERSTKEAHTRLAQKGYKESAISQAIERALACGLLDDQRFAQSLIKGKLSSGWGRRRIEQEFYRFGLSADAIEGYPHEFFNDEEQLERALKALRKHKSRSKNPRQASYRFLVGKGYSSEIASSALTLLESELSDTPEVF